MKKQVSALILAGGNSSRMGVCKADLDYQGLSFAAHQTAKLRGLGIEDVMLSGYENPVEGARFVPDLIAHRGPLSGIHAGLLAARNPHVLVLAVDTPLVPETLLAAVIERHETGITLASLDGEPEPLIGVYDTALAQECEEILGSSSNSIRRLMRREKVTLVPWRGDPGLLLNGNTPEEYARLIAHDSTRPAALQ